MSTAWICTQCQAGSVGPLAHVLRLEHEQWTAHKTADSDSRFTQTMLDDICIREDIITPLLGRRNPTLKEIDFPSSGEGVPQLDMTLTGASGGEQPGEGDLWQGEVCKRCMRRNCVEFAMPDEVWRTVVRSRWNCLCTTCFDEETEAGGVEYRFSEIWAVAWSQWGGGMADTGKPAPTWLDLCEVLARHLHRDDVDKQGEPYVRHLERVEARIPRELHVERAAAWLHDSMEHGHLRSQGLLYEIGIPGAVGETISDLTRSPDETYDAYIRRVGLCPRAALIKLWDIADNLNTSRGSIPDSLTKRYERARAYLLRVQKERVS